MKIAAKPMPMPHGEITEALMLTSPVGKATLEAILEGITGGFIHSKSVTHYLKNWKLVAKHGTCYGQASAIMIADQGAKAGQEKEVVKRARLADSICFQILSDLKGTVEMALGMAEVVPDFVEAVQKKAEKQAEIVEGKLKKAKKAAKKGDKKAKHKVEKLENEAKVLANPEKVKEAAKQVGNVFIGVVGAVGGVVGAGLLATGKKTSAKMYSRKISNLSRALVGEQAKLDLVEKKVFSKQNKKDVLELLKKLQADTSQPTVLRLGLHADGGGHAVAFFIAPRLSIYDSNIGMTSHKTAKSFFKAVDKVFISNKKVYKDHLDIEKYVIEIFKRKTQVV